MDSSKSQLVDRLKTANSVLITVSRDPSVDQLAACIGLTLLINKLGKHGSAVFSGKIPSTLEFLKPEETIEKTADSLRDFIIALDKNKADKLRYKVEDQLVKIFITPYKTSLSEKDLDFSQGDFNVELIIALGVRKQEDLDQAIVAHGRILHDATVASITTADQSDLGNISWRDPAASSLCELVTSLSESIGENLLDEQIATALLTGIIAETDRFSNEKTSPQTMSVSAKLMSAGANQQLVATNLNEPPPPVNLKKVDSDDKEVAQSTDDGTLSIKHENEDLELDTLPPPAEDQPEEPKLPEQDSPDLVSGGTKLVTEPPALGGMLTANTMPEQYDPSTDPLSGAIAETSEAVLGPPKTTVQPDTEQPKPPEPPVIPVPEPPAYTPPPPSWTPPAPPPPAEPIAPPPPQVETPPAPTPPEPKVEDNETLDQLEKAVDSPHVHKDGVNDARQKVEDVLSQGSDTEPRSDLNATPLGEPLHEEGNKLAIDPSLFSEPPSEGSSAPPVPPPLYPLNPDSNQENSQNK